MKVIALQIGAIGWAVVSVAGAALDVSGWLVGIALAVAITVQLAAMAADKT